ncbi:flavodoxin domain-containing protein [Seleniivibrio woodruffii]|uniref:Menaquinone-dependent protoporphyrinogen oxidase n=1 Tax=Seleniivibrio woodruffii TaxID=1078050 RepID=A0A4V2PRY4_9BACT|nr:flavodoxin domain-containing protein [Seleniivibrio woodruffii]TCK59831.1 menaquinone-dependent protoporphyrinogen oxidase [Seleniivibrio woodruffii]TVZ35948.1 menaquinone-dependent protoporphyrinogen oxidase [Seleniivibrio woodruffii]
MKVITIYASKYGSTKTVAEWITERFALEGFKAECADVETNPMCFGCDLILLGSGIYSHKFLPSIEQYIAENINLLMTKKTALFGVAMRTETFFRKGNAYGGAIMLERYGAMLGQKCIAGKILGGEMVFSRLSEGDVHRLEKFYHSIALSEAEKAQRMSPRTMMDKKQCWDFAEEILGALG